MPNVEGKRSLESTSGRAATVWPCCKILSTSGPLDFFFKYVNSNRLSLSSSVNFDTVVCRSTVTISVVNVEIIK